MSHSRKLGHPALTRRLYGHVVSATVVHCLVILSALAARSIAPWTAAMLLSSVLALAGHAAHVRRSGQQVGAPDRHAGAPPPTDSDTGD